jgi:hypothetical protein
MRLSAFAALRRDREQFVKYELCFLCSVNTEFHSVHLPKASLTFIQLIHTVQVHLTFCIR